MYFFGSLFRSYLSDKKQKIKKAGFQFVGWCMINIVSKNHTQIRKNLSGAWSIYLPGSDLAGPARRPCSLYGSHVRHMNYRSYSGTCHESYLLCLADLHHQVGSILRLFFARKLVHYQVDNSDKTIAILGDKDGGPQKVKHEGDEVSKMFVLQNKQIDGRRLKVLAFSQIARNQSTTHSPAGIRSDIYIPKKKRDERPNVGGVAIIGVGFMRSRHGAPSVSKGMRGQKVKGLRQATNEYVAPPPPSTPLP